jgi:hypothetical protein
MEALGGNVTEEKEEKQNHLGEIEQMKALIEKDKRERVDKCRAEIMESLNKYNCVIDASATLTTPSPLNPQGISFVINILAKE